MLVLEELKQYLGEYKFIQVGIKDDPTFNGIDIDLRSKCNIKQTAYVIKNASLFIGVDSFPIHIAGYYKVPLVGIYCNSFSSCVRPYFGDKSTQRIIDTPRLNNEYPSFSFNETPQTILRIKPEMIVNAALELLNIEPLIDFKTVFIGEQFNNIVLDCIPNQVVPKQFNPEIVPYIRYDLGSEEMEANVYNQVYERKSIIITDKKLNIDILKKLRHNLAQFIIEIKDDSLVDFIKSVHFSGINYVLVTYLTDEQLNKYKLAYSDYNLILKLPQKQKSDFIKDDIYLKREWSKLTDYNNVYFKSNKYILSNNQIFLGMANYKQNKPLAQKEEWYKYEDFGDEELNNLFWRDGDFYVMQTREKK